jgi:hypothetical protein
MKLEKKWRLYDLLSGELCFIVSFTPECRLSVLLASLV